MEIENFRFEVVGADHTDPHIAATVFDCDFHGVGDTVEDAALDALRQAMDREGMGDVAAETIRAEAALLEPPTKPSYRGDEPQYRVYLHIRWGAE